MRVCILMLSLLIGNLSSAADFSGSARICFKPQFLKYGHISENDLVLQGRGVRIDEQYLDKAIFISQSQTLQNYENNLNLIELAITSGADICLVREFFAGEFDKSQQERLLEYNLVSASTWAFQVANGESLILKVN